MPRKPRPEASVENQPVSSVRWVPRDQLAANDYNPNHVAPPELELLAISIREDGWSQPIVVTSDFEIVDGFHRWRVAARPEIAAMTGGLVPVVVLDRERSHRMMSTIRHNRARGSHHILKMADIVGRLQEAGLSEAEIQERLQMDEEEVVRLLDRSGMTVRGAGDGFGREWIPAADVKGSS
jgi:ParB-like chromosome segregation protein Spo0J